MPDEFTATEETRWLAFADTLNFDQLATGERLKSLLRYCWREAWDSGYWHARENEVKED
jgi:hypothetical protein